uniref:VWFA domain-containing protein n=1 Tax=Panagrolaimus superbus TaxID=310955 RepID=A0A914Z762_9BILA
MSTAEDFQRKKELARNIDLCFLLDVTGSMQPYIDQCRDSIKQIVEILMPTKTRYSGIAKLLRLSIVGYRDHGDEKQFEILEFTESPEIFRNFVSSVPADGGADLPEDVFGGLEKALDLSWSDQCGTKVIFHIADAPCHGNKYHNLRSGGDDYPNGDPKERTETMLFGRMKEKDIDYHFGRINQTTDKMIQVFSEAYGSEIKQYDILKITMAESVISAVCHSVTVRR